MTKTISIYIFLEDEPSVECITAGNSAEHNATTLKFILESTFTDEFKYYLDFVLPNGKILRTDYLLIEILGRNSFFFFKHLHSFKKFLIHFNNHSFQGSAVFFRHGDYCLLHIKVVKLYKRSFLLFKGHSAALIEFNRDKTRIVIL